MGGAREASCLRLRAFLSVAEGGRAHDAEVSQGAEDVHDPDHRAVQVRLPSPRPIPAELQAHLSSQLQLHPAGSATSGQHLPPQLEVDGLHQARARVTYKHHVLFYMR